MIVSITIVRYRKALVPFALLAMAVHRLPMLLQKGCTFHKLFGMGKKGDFTLRPDWQQWGLLAVWQGLDDFDRFMRRSFVARWWRLFTQESWTVLCAPLQSHGRWDGKEPFGTTSDKNYTGPVAVLTRATIRLSKLKRFWAAMDDVAPHLQDAPGFILSYGIGEAPIYRQGTFSVWQNMDGIKAFAYISRQHAGVIKDTRAENWYSEELFARFKPIESFGTMNGKDPLAGMIK